MRISHRDEWQINESIRHPSAAIVNALASYTTTQIADCGGPVYVMDPGVRPVTSAANICGPAVTVWTRPGDVLFLLKAPDLVEAGDVLVVDGAGRLDAAVLGDICVGVVAQRGGRGLVVDGVVRDLEGIEEAGVPTFARGAHPTIGSKVGPGALNVTIQCGGVTVWPGDIIRGDATGIVVIPREHAEAVLRLTKEVAESEADWVARARRDGSLSDVFGLDARIAELRDKQKNSAK